MSALRQKRTLLVPRVCQDILMTFADAPISKTRFPGVAQWLGLKGWDGASDRKPRAQLYRVAGGGRTSGGMTGVEAVGET